MSLARNSKIYLAVFELAQYLYGVTMNFKKENKPSIGKRIEDTVLDLGDLIVEANSSVENRYSVLGVFLIKYEKLQFLINLAVQLKDISYRQQAEIARRMESIGKQANGWRKSSLKKP